MIVSFGLDLSSVDHSVSVRLKHILQIQKCSSIPVLEVSLSGALGNELSSSGSLNINSDSDAVSSLLSSIVSFTFLAFELDNLLGVLSLSDDLASALLSLGDLDDLSGLRADNLVVLSSVEDSSSDATTVGFTVSLP